MKMFRPECRRSVRGLSLQRQSLGTLWAAYGAATNSYESNSRNQYSQVFESGAEVEVAYDIDGNMTLFGEWAYAYDSGNRLVSVSSNNTPVATFSYDAQGRRVKKVAADGTHRYFYDGWLLIYEHIVRPDSTTNEIDYVWGKDVSGARDGAAGIGGLLYLKRDGIIYVPFYDAYGNILGYCDAQGNVVARYTYDAFGKLIAKSGPLADFFRHRFSTKYFDCESGLYYYGYRFYHPVLMRWLTEDPIGVDGGINCYVTCNNNLLSQFDLLGLLTYKKLAANYPLPTVYKTSLSETNNIWQLIGGKVLLNAQSGIFNNSCAIRLSHALNKTGELIPYINEQTSSGKNPPKWWYIYRVKQMKSYLTQKYGAPVVYKRRDKFVKCAPKGILLLEAVWSDASGHATLWDGKNTIDKSDDYFNKPNPTFNLWRLK